MRIQDIAWAAGFLEGEGYFYSRARVSIRAAQVQLEPLEKMRSILGGKVNGPYQPKQPNHRPFYDWQLNGHHAIAAMMTLYTLMSPKRKEAIRVAISKWKVSPGNSRLWIARGFCKNGHDLTGANYKLYPSGHGQCMQCAREGRKRYYDKNKDKWTIYSRQYRERKRLGLSGTPTA
jgi:hypothetical protein